MQEALLGGAMLSLFNQDCPKPLQDEQAYHESVFQLCKLQLLVIFQIKSSFEDGKLEATKSCRFWS